MQDISLPARFWAKVDRSGGSDACWPWLGATTVEGYPIYVNSVDRLVRRYLWFLIHGDVPNGEIVACRSGNVGCVNPSHLVRRTYAERTQIAKDRGTFFSPFNAATPSNRTKYATRAKAVVDAHKSRHLITPAQRGKGHATRGCTTGGQPKRASYDMPKADRLVLLRDPCVYCNGVATEVDHIQPFARGGSHGWINRAPTCMPCNRAKNDKGLLRFLVARQSMRVSAA